MRFYQMTAMCFSLLATCRAAVVAGDDSILARNAEVRVEASVAFTEGPAWHPDRGVLFSDGTNNRIMRRDRDGKLHVFRQPSGTSNGLLFDHRGRLIACEQGNRRVTQTEEDGTITVLADQYKGKRFNTPNDVAVDSRGRIYFTDPRYGDRSDMEMFDAMGRGIEGVYRIDTDGKVERIITHEVDRPNGIAVSAGDRFLYVADNVNDRVGGARKLWRFPLNDGGTVNLASRKLLFDWGSDRGPDGMALDQKGQIYVAAGLNVPNPPLETAGRYRAGIYVLSPEGRLLTTIPVPLDEATNCTFGDDDLRTLYFTAGHRLLSVRVNTPGQLAWPPAR